LRSAQSQIRTLQQQLDRANSQQASASRSGFLSRDPWATSATQSHYSPPVSPVSPGYAPMGVPTGQSPFGSFLGSAAATAAGVAGGAFLFHGMESLMGHHGYGPGSSVPPFKQVTTHRRMSPSISTMVMTPMGIQTMRWRVMAKTHRQPTTRTGPCPDEFCDHRLAGVSFGRGLDVPG
jgi:hypothetical protein